MAELVSSLVSFVMRFFCDIHCGIIDDVALPCVEVGEDVSNFGETHICELSHWPVEVHEEVNQDTSVLQ